MMKKFVLSFALSIFALASIFSQDVSSRFKKSSSSTKKINITASLISKDGEEISKVKPNDTIKFKIETDAECYISILCIDANGVKTWLPISNNLMEEKCVRYFPDKTGWELKVSNDGVFGDEEVIIYAATTESALPSKNDTSTLSNQSSQMKMKSLKLSKSDSNIATGSCKIAYTIVEK